MSDAYALALQSRRGDGLDSSLYAPPTPESAPPPQSAAPMPPTAPSPQADQILPPQGAAPAQDPPNPEDEVAKHVTGGATEGEYEMLKGMKPRSLGERAKMDALKSQYGSRKNG